ncbi:MAG: hypothetical protein IJ151_06595 [Bacteroidales bacterium]|nr:hypothetical protein [Bacteroidales bacterium]
MRKEKLAYKAPTSEAFVIRFEVNFMSPGTVQKVDEEEEFEGKDDWI